MSAPVIFFSFRVTPAFFFQSRTRTQDFFFWEIMAEVKVEQEAPRPDFIQPITQTKRKIPPKKSDTHVDEKRTKRARTSTADQSEQPSDKDVYVVETISFESYKVPGAIIVAESIGHAKDLLAARGCTNILDNMNKKTGFELIDPYTPQVWMLARNARYVGDPVVGESVNNKALNFYLCKNHDMPEKISAFSLIVAESPDSAVAMMDDLLRSRGLSPSVDHDYDLIAINTFVSGVHTIKCN